MRHRNWGRAGTVAAIGQGTWNMEGDDRASCIAALRKGLDLGMTHIDTAEMYGAGRVEELVGAALEGRRDEVFLVSKVLPQNASYEGTRRACEKSLKRLKTDRLDSYLLHWPGAHPLEDTFRAFEKLESDGKILSWGLSNFDASELDEAISIAGAGRIACNQALYHLGERAIEHAVLPGCQRHRIALVAYSPFGSGSFPSDKTVGGRLLAEIAHAHNAAPHQVALAFLLRDPTVVAIPKASRMTHTAENAGADGVTLTAEEVKRIDTAFPRGKPRSLPML